MYRVALWALVVVVLASTLTTLPGVLGASPSYTLTGIVAQPGGAPVPNGVQVDLVSRATGTVYTTTTFGNGGQFTFTSTSTSGALGPGYWGLWVPPQGNQSFAGCSPCAILPQSQDPVFNFFSASQLTSPTFSASINNTQALGYPATLSGTVNYEGSPALGATVRLLAPVYNDFVLSVTKSNATTGAYSLKVPKGTWVLQSTLPGPAPQYQNETQVTISSPTPPAVNPDILSYLISGAMETTSGSRVLSPGNATLFDATNGYLYSMATPSGGYYQLGTYPNFATNAAQTFNVVLSAAGYSTRNFTHSVASGSGPFTQNLELPTVTPGQLGVYNTTLDFSGINVQTGKGSLVVQTIAQLGNDSTFPNLPNATVGQLWGQLGLDFAHSLTFPSSDLGAIYAWENSTGPFFPAFQAGTAVNGTPFFGPTSRQNLSSASSTCSGNCDLTSPATLSFSWSETYGLNGTLAKNSSSYTISFNFRHPTSNGDVYNYTLVLPAGFVLKAGSAVPADSRLSPAGANDTWTRFTLSALPSATAGGSASFTIVKYAALTALVNATVSDFTFSNHNVFDSTNGNYTVQVGVNQNVTFSALNSLYPAGTNGTRFAWTFGDGTSATTSTPTVNHTYTSASGSVPNSSPYTGTLTVTSSGGLTNATTFHVWVGSGPVTAGLANNATAAQVRTAGSTTYLFVDWGTTLQFNATPSSAKITPTAPIPGNISVASYSLTSSGGFQQTANFSASQGSSYVPFSNWSVQFLGAGSYLSSGNVNGTAVPFKGWQYTLTLTVWSATGQSASTRLTVLVNDTEKPVSAFQVLNSAGQPISGKVIIALSNLSALVQLNGANATDPHNGSIAHYYWLITNSAISTVHLGFNASTVRPYPSAWLAVSATAYTVNLTVTDLNGNTGYATQSLTVSANTTTTPVMSATNLTAPSKLTAGTSYTIWVNVTTGVGTKSVASNVQVAFYTTSPGGTSRSYIAGTPGSVKFYNYTSPGVVNTVAMATGTLASLPYNQTVRAVITWSPVATGNFVLYANISAANQFTGTSTSNLASTSITVSPNPTTQLLEYVAIGVAVVVVLGLIIVYYRRRSRRTSTPRSSGRSGLERGGGKRPSEDADEDDE